ncbi:MAG TPA: permease [Bacteroidetes bacterium]|nr:permease [Bacteroidota bacterium]
MNTHESMSSMPVAAASADVRARFITRTYMHLFGAILGFTLIEVWLFSSGAAETIARVLLSGSWLLVLGAFMIVGWLASKTAMTSTSPGMQYAALAGFVVAEAIIFVPLLYVAQSVAGGGVIENAALVTLAGFSVLTYIAHSTGKDFSFLGSILRWGGFIAIAAIVGSVFLGFQLGTWFIIAMIGFAGAAILYDTSQVLHSYPPDRHVAAALQLFSSVALLFWYVLQFFISSDD